jgi:hypothetical protein
MCQAFDMQEMIMMMMMTIIIIIARHHSLLTFLKSMMNHTAVVFKNQVKALYEGNHLVSFRHRHNLANNNEWGRGGR